MDMTSNKAPQPPAVPTKNASSNAVGTVEYSVPKSVKNKADANKEASHAGPVASTLVVATPDIKVAVVSENTSEETKKPHVNLHTYIRLICFPFVWKFCSILYNLYLFLHFF